MHHEPKLKIDSYKKAFDELCEFLNLDTVMEFRDLRQFKKDREEQEIFWKQVHFQLCQQVHGLAGTVMENGTDFAIQTLKGKLNASRTTISSHLAT